jgi:regulator of sigma E protease
MSWLLVFLGFTLLIVLHELGHFLAAKATGMRVERFFVFFLPKLASIKRGETEYGIGVIPLGGYVKITGMNPEEELPPEVASRGYYRQPVWKRIVVIGAGPAVNIALAFAILFVVIGLNARNVTQTVGDIVPGSPASKTLRSGDTILAVDGHTYPGADRDTRLTRFARDVASHKCAGKPSDGCQAVTPAILRVKHDGRARTIAIHPVYDSSIGRTRIGFSY